MNIFTYITTSIVLLALIQGCTTNNSKNIRDYNEGNIRKTPNKDYYTLVKASEVSMLKAKNLVLKSSTDFCRSKDKKLLPISTNIGIQTGWFMARKSYELNYSCVDDSRINKEIEMAAGVVAPPNGKSGLYLFRDESFTGHAILYGIKIDGIEVGTLSTGSFIYGQLAPGDHSLSIAITGEATALKITTSLNKNLYITMGAGWIDVSVDEIKESEAKKLFSSYTHSKDNMFKDKSKF